MASRRPILITLLLVMLAACRAGEKQPAGPVPEDLPAQSIEPLLPVEIRPIFARSCTSCHGQDGRGIMGIAPDLRRIQPRGVDQWVTFLRQPNRSHPVKSPPPVWLTEEEIQLMARWLATIDSSP